MQDLYVATNGIRLHVHDYADNGPAVIFLHYGGGNLACWNGVVPFLAPDYHVVAIDTRGHGLSDSPKQGYDLSTMAADVLGVMDYLGVGKAHFVGSSMGGEISVCLAAAHPERVLSVACEGALQNVFGKYALYDTPVELRNAKKQELLERIRLNPRPTFATLDDLLEHARQTWPTWNELHEETTRAGTYQRNDGRWAYRQSELAREEYAKAFWDTDFEPFFQTIRCPVLFVPGEEEFADAAITAATALFRSYLRCSRVELLKGAHHACTMMDMPDAFTGLIKDFFAGVDSPGEQQRKGG
jgi:2-succinyl-6-hydroxy-2,4-cyclohexadiene-1-carboxylate synthase